MDTRSLGFDPLTGVETVFHFDEATEAITLEDREDVTDLLDLNKAQAAAASSGYKGDMHHVARLPMTVYLELKRKGIVDDPVRFKKWLNDRDNRYFRTKPGQV